MYGCHFTLLKCKNSKWNLKEVTQGIGDKLALLLIVGKSGPLGTKRPWEKGELWVIRANVKKKNNNYWLGLLKNIRICYNTD